MLIRLTHTPTSCRDGGSMPMATRKAAMSTRLCNLPPAHSRLERRSWSASPSARNAANCVNQSFRRRRKALSTLAPAAVASIGTPGFWGNIHDHKM